MADWGRSITFYRDVLGFSLEPTSDSNAAVEFVRGAARIHLVQEDTAPDSTGERRPRGTSILFLETDDVVALRDVLIGRGGKPSEMEKVNWIKMRMFEIKDPDGHTLWFGQSFQEPGRDPDPARQIRRLLPELPLSDISAGVAYYQKVLGFRINYAQDDLGVMDRDDVTLILSSRNDEHRGIGSCYAYVRDADALHAELLARGARVQGDPISHPWGLRDFQVLDLEGNRITFGQPFE